MPVDLHCVTQLFACSEYSKTLNEVRLKVLAAREEAIQGVVKEARNKVKDVSKNPQQYKRLLQDLLVQVGCCYVCGPLCLLQERGAPSLAS